MASKKKQSKPNLGDQFAERAVVFTILVFTIVLVVYLYKHFAPTDTQEIQVPSVPAIETPETMNTAPSTEAQ